MVHRHRMYDEGNRQFELVSLREIVADPQFRSGYRDRLANRPPQRFYYDSRVGERRDTWGYERGRLTAMWLLATGQKPPRTNDFGGLVQAYRAALAADAVL
jgi:hypothetical protein